MSHIGQHSDTRSSNRKAKQESELRHKLEEAEAKLIKEKKYKDAMMMAALRKLTPKQMKELGITIIYGEPDPNATPSSPNYMRPTTASARHRVAKGGRRTRKRRNGKKKTMRKGGRMRRRRHHHSRNKRGGGEIDIDLAGLMRHSGNDGYTIVLGDTGYSIGVINTICFLMGEGQNYYKHITKITLTTVDDENRQCPCTLNVEYVKKTPTVSDNLSLKDLIRYIAQNRGNNQETFNPYETTTYSKVIQINQEVANELLIKSDVSRVFEA